MAGGFPFITSSDAHCVLRSNLVEMDDGSMGSTCITNLCNGRKINSNSQCTYTECPHDTIPTTRIDQFCQPCSCNSTFHNCKCITLSLNKKLAFGIYTETDFENYIKLMLEFIEKLMLKIMTKLMLKIISN